MKIVILSTRIVAESSESDRTILRAQILLFCYLNANQNMTNDDLE